MGPAILIEKSHQTSWIWKGSTPNTSKLPAQTKLCVSRGTFVPDQAPWIYHGLNTSGLRCYRCTTLPSDYGMYPVGRGVRTTPWTAPIGQSSGPPESTIGKAQVGCRLPKFRVARQSRRPTPSGNLPSPDEGSQEPHPKLSQTSHTALVKPEALWVAKTASCSSGVGVIFIAKAAAKWSSGLGTPEISGGRAALWLNAPACCPSAVRDRMRTPAGAVAGPRGPSQSRCCPFRHSA